MQCPSCQTPVDSAQRFCPNCGTVIAPTDGQAPDPMLGQTLGGKYKIVRLLGEGGMGCVYEGEQPLGTAKRKVAIKTLHPHLSRDAKIKARFEREVGTVAELEHPNTIQVYDFGTTEDGILYIVMEFLHGRSLADLLEKEGAMQPERAAYIVQQVCGSLEEAHSHGIVHRDLKPDNIVLVDRAGKKDFVKVLDFGIAKRSNEEDRNEQKLTQQGMVLGTPPYMSPEQFTGRPIDARSDIYSLAVVCYEMLTGKLPFKADTAWEWATQHMTQAPIPIESLAEGMRAPEAMRGAIRRALAKSPDERFQTVKEFSDTFTGGGAMVMPPRAPMASNASDPGVPHPRTEMGQPLDVGAAFGRAPTPPGMAAPMVGGMMQPGQGYTPVGGNVAFPTPAGIPQPPVREEGGRGRMLLLIPAALIAVLSVGGIWFGISSSSGGGGKPVNFANDPPPPATTLASGPPAVDTATASPSSTGVIPPLNGGKTPSPHPSPHLAPTQGPTAAPMPGPGPGPGLQNGGVPAPPLPPGQTPGTRQRYDGPECQTARRLKQMGRERQAESYALSCIARGGDPN